MMQGIDSSFDACLFIGYHAKAGTVASVLDHTISGGTVSAVKVNGVELPEMGLNGAIAGYYNVPVVMLSGDAETCRQAQALFGSEVVTAAVKEGIGRYAARLLPFGEARHLIQEGAKEAILKRAKIKPFKINPPCQFELAFLTSGQAELAELIPQVKRTSARAVSFETPDFIQGFKLLRALIALAPSR
jgi:D-amino peptidase